jgi:hypothetical protein
LASNTNKDTTSNKAEALEVVSAQEVMRSVLVVEAAHRSMKESVVMMHLLFQATASVDHREEASDQEAAAVV